METPTVFISYAHEGPEHDQWVIDLASALRLNGVDASLDIWDLIPGQETTLFMESQIRNSDFVILIITAIYKEKSNIPAGGVGYEKNIISAEMLQSRDLRPKFIPILRRGNFQDTIPTFLGSKFAIDFRDGTDREASLSELLRAIFRQPNPKKPPLGKVPFTGGDETLATNPDFEEFIKKSTPDSIKIRQVGAGDIEFWEKEAAGRFDYLRNNRISKSKKDPFIDGFWQASFILNAQIPSMSLINFLNILRASKTGRTGWDIGWVPTRAAIAPYPYKKGIEVWLAEDGDKDPGSSDFWRAELAARFSLFRGYQEDGADFKKSDGKKLLDYSLVLWRVSEFLLYLENFSKQLNVIDADATVKFHWHGLEKRRLWNHMDPFSTFENETDICSQDNIESLANISSCGLIKNNLIDDVHKITLPLFEGFNFFTIEKLRIKKIIKNLFDPDKEIPKA